MVSYSVSEIRRWLSLRVLKRDLFVRKRYPLRQTRADQPDTSADTTTAIAVATVTPVLAFAEETTTVAVDVVAALRLP